MTATALKACIAGVAALLAGVLGVLRYFSYRTRRDRISVVGQAFNSTVEGLSSDAEAKKLAAASLLRRFFDKGTEAGCGRRPLRARGGGREPRLRTRASDCSSPGDGIRARGHRGVVLDQDRWRAAGTATLVMANCTSRLAKVPRSRPLSRDRTRCPRCPASRGTTRCRHRQAVVARVPRRARPVVRIRPQVRPGALHPRARCRPARQDAADS